MHVLDHPREIDQSRASSNKRSLGEKVSPKEASVCEVEAAKSRYRHVARFAGWLASREWFVVLPSRLRLSGRQVGFLASALACAAATCLPRLELCLCRDYKPATALPQGSAALKQRLLRHSCPHHLLAPWCLAWSACQSRASAHPLDKEPICCRSGGVSAAMTCLL